MKLGVCAQAFYGLDLPRALALAAEIGFEAIELPVDGGSPFCDLDELLDGGWERLAEFVDRAGLTISAVSNHQEGQLLLGPHGVDTDRIFAGSAEEKVEFATQRLKKTARLAALLDVGIVCGFMGCEAWDRWFPWPVETGFEDMLPTMRSRMVPILDAFGELGVVFAHECHPRQIAYNIETAFMAVEALDEHPAFRFNLDPANLLLAGVDPAIFAAELGSLVVHCHAKDGEIVRRNVGRSGILAHGAWSRPDRGFRFRVAGWGHVNWRELITELQIHGYQGVLAVEHEDPTMSSAEGLRQASRFLEPLLLRAPVPAFR